MELRRESSARTTDSSLPKAIQQAGVARPHHVVYVVSIDEAEVVRRQVGPLHMFRNQWLSIPDIGI